MNRLTPKQAKFVEEFLVDFNGTKAAIRAGYSPKTARFQASRMLANVDIQESFLQRCQELQEANDLTPEKVIAELEKIAFARMDTYTNWGPDGVQLVASDNLPDGAAAAVSEVSEVTTDKGHNIRFKLHDKAASLDKLLKYMQWKQEMRDLDARIKALEEQIANRTNGHHALG
jgi:phage terminase small subunit